MNDTGVESLRRDPVHVLYMPLLNRQDISPLREIIPFEGIIKGEKTKGEEVEEETIYHVLLGKVIFPLLPIIKIHILTGE